MNRLNYKELLIVILASLLPLTLNLLYNFGVWGKSLIILSTFAVLLWVLIFSKNKNGEFYLLSKIGDTTNRHLVYLIALILLTTLSYLYVSSYLLDPHVEVLSSTVHPDSGIVIYSEDLDNRTYPKLDIKFNGIEFDSSAIPHERGNHYWSFRPSSLNNIPNDLLKHGISSIQVGHDGKYYEKETNIFVDSSTIRRSPQPKINLKKGGNLVSYHLNESTPTTEAFEPIRQVLLVVKDEQGRMYMPSKNIDQINSLEPGEGYTVYVSSDTSFFFPRP